MVTTTIVGGGGGSGSHIGRKDRRIIGGHFVFFIGRRRGRVEG